MYMFSASDLVARSAAQLLFKQVKKLQWKATPRQLKGNEYAEAIVAKEEASAERRGIIKHNDDLLFFCVDMVKDNTYIEIKKVDDQTNYEPWYLHAAIMQSTLYASLLQDVMLLDTPKFRKKEGYKQELTYLNDQRNYELWFGTERFKIEPDDEIKAHFITKMELLSTAIPLADFETCRQWDRQYKFNEFNMFNPKYARI